MSAAAAAVKSANDTDPRAQSSPPAGRIGESSKAFPEDVATAAANPVGNSNTKKDPL